MGEYIISREQAKLLAVGMYRDIGTWVADAKRDNPIGYEQFKADYLVATEVPPIKRRQSHKRPDNSHKVERD